MKTEIVKGNLVLTIPIDPNAPVSKSGKSRIVAGTSGFTKTEVQVDGKTVSVSVNAIVPL